MAKDGLELLTFLSPPLGTRVTIIHHHTQLLQGWGADLVPHAF